jgi:hypothetical protein
MSRRYQDARTSKVARLLEEGRPRAALWTATWPDLALWCAACTLFVVWWLS